LAKKGAPINCFAMPIAGASSPMTLAGTLVQHTAEVLAMITTVQLINPGTPVAYGGMACAMDMRTGDITLASSSLALFASALTTMARYYGLPAYNAATYTDAFVPDVQCGVEKAISSLVGMAAGSDVGMFGGDLNDAMTVSYEQLLIDYDIWETACRVLRGVLVDQDTLAQEVIQRVGSDGQFMADPHTLAWLRRDEHFLGRFFNRDRSRENARSMLENAHARVEHILAEGRGSYSIPPQTVAERIDSYVREERDRIRRGRQVK
jgi:trimethylamine--corrinoid protein Co-methyltransferase